MSKPDTEDAALNAGQVSGTIYNPNMKVRITFHEPRPYELDELKTRLIELVNRDDDVRD